MSTDFKLGNWEASSQSSKYVFFLKIFSLIQFCRGLAQRTSYTYFALKAQELHDFLKIAIVKIQLETFTPSKLGQKIQRYNFYPKHKLG